MGRTFLVLMTVLLLVAVGFAVYSVRSDALQARDRQLANQNSKNAALSDEITRLDAFLHSPLCQEVMGHSQTPKS